MASTIKIAALDYIDLVVKGLGQLGVSEKVTTPILDFTTFVELLTLAKSQNIDLSSKKKDDSLKRMSDIYDSIKKLIFKDALVKMTVDSGSFIFLLNCISQESELTVKREVFDIFI